MNNRGSTWNKWDLHVHTPYSFIQHYGDNQNPQTWENYLADLENLDPAIKVIGVNDYCIIDGYERLCKDKSNGRLANIELLLPIIELRLDVLTGNFLGETNRINYHTIFSNEVSCSDIRDNFLNVLRCTANFDGTNPVIASLTQSGLESIGKSYKASVPQQAAANASDLLAGFNTFQVSKSDIDNALECTCFKSKYLTAIGVSEWSDVRWNQNPGIKRTIISSVDFVFTASPTIDQFDTNLQCLRDNSVNDKLIHCSDAHFPSSCTNAKENRKIGNTFSWIKSEISFDGLMQVSFEYSGRYKASPFSPSRTSASQIIDYVEYNCGDKVFGNQRIYLNEGLNCVIGGKSSGKSLLLYAIAKSIDKTQVERLEADNGRLYYDFQPPFGFNVRWKDGAESNFPSATNKAITFIPQLYINSIAEDGSKDKGLNKIVLDVLQSRLEFKSQYEVIRERIRTTQATLHEHINTFLNRSEQIGTKKEQIKSLGEKGGFETQIVELDVRISELQKQSLFSETEQLEYQDLLKAQTAKKETIGLLRQEDASISVIASEFSASESPAWDRIAKSIEKLLFKEINRSESTTSRLRSLLDASIEHARVSLQAIFTTLLASLDSLKVKITEELSINESELADIDAKISEFASKLTSKTQYDEITKQKTSIMDTIAKINSFEVDLALIDIQGAEEAIFASHSEYIELLQKMRQLCLNNSGFADDANLKLDCEIGLSFEAFDVEFASKFILRKKLKETLSVSHFDDENQILFSVDNYASVSRDIFRSITQYNGDIPTKKGVTHSSLLHGLFSDCLYIKFDIEKNGDKLLKMSPGKKGITLFQLFLQLSSSSSPILIDQPEDNLDNRTVYKDLNEFIKARKASRQIIMVTHNPNLVVSTDSENIIVANQSGQGSGENGDFMFEYVNGGLESSFTKNDAQNILESKGIREHVCEILEGGEDAFKRREQKYQFE